jgi:hypothetical protein
MSDPMADLAPDLKTCHTRSRRPLFESSLYRDTEGPFRAVTSDAKHVSSLHLGDDLRFTRRALPSAAHEVYKHNMRSLPNRQEFLGSAQRTVRSIVSIHVYRI